MPTVRFHREAEEEAAEVALWYDNQQIDLGQDFLRELNRSMVAIIEGPHIWPCWPGTMTSIGVRKFLMTRFPYAIAYTVDEDGPVIVAVAHLKRRPRYWSDRL